MGERNDFGDAVRTQRLALGYSQTELAERIGVPQAMISRIENGQEPEMPTLRKLADALESRVSIYPNGKAELSSQGGYLKTARGLPLSEHLGFEVNKPLRSELRAAMRKVLKDEGARVVNAVFADEIKEEARGIFMRATNSKQSQGTPCLSRLLGLRCGMYRGQCSLHDPPGSDHTEMFNCDGQPKYFVMHPYKMSGKLASELFAYCERHGLVYLIWPYLDWYYPGAAMAVIIQNKDTDVQINY